MTTSMIARRPVFDLHERVFAYDLTGQEAVGATGFFQELSPEQLIAQVFLEIGLDRVTDGHTACLPVSRDLLVGGTLPDLPADRVILGIPESIASDAECVMACTKLAAGGHRLAVPVIDLDAPRALLAAAHVIRIDVTAFSAPDLAALADRLREHPARLLATNVRHAGQRDVCATLGFDLFEGYHFSTPETPAIRDVGIEHLTVFRVLKLVRDPDASDLEIETMLQRDVGLTYKLLRMVNSAATGARGISSIGHALRLLGREQVGRWLAILLVTDGNNAGVRGELMQLALIRARMCELFADLANARASRGPLFLVGMVSVLDQLLEVPLERLCDAMELAPELREALLHRSGFLGDALRLVEAYVAAAWSEVASAATALKVDAAQLLPLYLDALAWAKAHQSAGEASSA